MPGESQGDVRMYLPTQKRPNQDLYDIDQKKKTGQDLGHQATKKENQEAELIVTQRNRTKQRRLLQF